MVQEIFKLLPLDQILHAVLEHEAGLQVSLDHAPELLLADAKVIRGFRDVEGVLLPEGYRSVSGKRVLRRKQGRVR